ncbi:MAG: hypothetical protein KJT01_16725 [Gemmatimonadetes bacterium]|nr:hypothetical protein [Gemmatimonadota bacterium]
MGVGSVSRMRAFGRWVVVGFLWLAGAAAACGATNRWDAEVAAFARTDAIQAPPSRPVLFVGSSTVRAWRTLAADFPGQPVLNRGFGGCHLSDVNHHFDRVVGAYRPRVIVLYAGDNDLVEGKTASDVSSDLAEFRRLVRERVPEARCAFLAIKPSPKRVSALEVQREANALAAAQVRGDRQWTVLDTFTPLLGADGRPDATLFKDDHLHLNPEGYRRWAGVIRPWLESGTAGR